MMHAYRCIGIDLADQVLIELLGQERHERGEQRREGDQRFVQRRQGRRIGLTARRPEAGPAAADIPVAQVVEKALDGA